MPCSGCTRTARRKPARAVDQAPQTEGEPRPPRSRRRRARDGARLTPVRRAEPRAAGALGNPPERVVDVRRRLPPRVRVLFEASGHDAVQQRRRERLARRQRRGRVLQNRADDAGRRLPRERPHARRHLVDHRAERPESHRASASRPSTCSGAMYGTVPSIVPPAVPAWRWRARSSGTSRSGPPGPSAWPGRSRAAGAPLGQHDVAGFQVAVDHATAVGIVEGVGDLRRESALVEGQRTVRQPRRERLAFETRHHRKSRPLALADVVDRRCADGPAPRQRVPRARSGHAGRGRRRDAAARILSATCGPGACRLPCRPPPYRRRRAGDIS